MMLAGIVHMDHLWRRLQVMDEAGNAVLDLALEDTNPYCIAGSRMCADLSKDASTGPFAVILQHFASDDPVKQLQMTSELFYKQARLIAHLRWRLEDPCQDWFIQLLRAVHPRLSEAEQSDVVEKFWKASKCDMAANSSLKFRSQYSGPSHMFNAQSFKMLMRRFGRVGRLCNMQTERLLALIKASTDLKSPTLDRVISSGFLTQLRTEHMNAGGSDPRYVTGTALKEDGAPLQSSVRSSNHPNKVRPCILYANIKMEQHRHNMAVAGQPAPSKLETSRLMSEFAASYSSLSEAERQESDAKAEAARLREPENDSGMTTTTTRVAAHNAPGLWCQSHKDLPVKYESMKKSFLKFSQLPLDEWYGDEDSKLPSFTAAAGQMRKQFVESAIIRDHGD